MTGWARAIALLAGLGAASAQAQIDVVTLPLAPHGDAMPGPTWQIVPLGTRAFLAAAEGPDGEALSPDDRVLLVRQSGGGWTITPLATPNVVSCGPPVRLSADRALVAGEGPDGQARTADDLVFLLDGLQRDPIVVPIPVGPLFGSFDCTPVRLSADSAAILTPGIEAGTPDPELDTLTLLTDLGAIPTVTRLPAPHSTYGVPIVLSPTRLLLGSEGYDTQPATLDDRVYLFEDLGARNLRSELPAACLATVRSRLGLRVGPRSALLATSDDRVGCTSQILQLSDLGGRNRIRALGVPQLSLAFPNRLLSLGAGAALVGRRIEQDGPDQVGFYFLSHLAARPRLRKSTLDFVLEEAAESPALLDARRLVVAGFGPDGKSETADDELRVFDVVRRKSVRMRRLGALAYGGVHVPLVLDSHWVLVALLGADLAPDGGDDHFALVDLFADPPVATPVTPGGSFGQITDLAGAPRSLGPGRVVHLATGDDGELGEGGDDAFRILDGLPGARRLDVQEGEIAGDEIALRATLALDGWADFGDSDLTVSLGRDAQTLSVEERVAKRRRDSYRAPDPSAGFIESLEFDRRSGALHLRAKLSAPLDGSAELVLEFGDQLFAAPLPTP